MSAKLLLVVLVAGALFVSGCTQSPAPAGGAAAATPAGGAAAGGAAAGGGSTPGITTTSGSAEAFGQGILNCQAGTPWSFSGAQAGAGYTVTYTISGYVSYKGGQYCKVVGTASGSGVPPGFSVEYYFLLNPTRTGYSDMCYKINIQGAPSQEACVPASTLQK